DVRILRDVTPIKLKSVLGEIFHRSSPALLLFDVLFAARVQQGFQSSCDHQLQVPFRKHRIGIFPVQDFALLPDTQAAGERVRRLSHDGAVGWTTTTSYCPAPSMKETKIYIAGARDLVQIAVSFVNLPGTGEHAAVLVRVGIT